MIRKIPEEKILEKLIKNKTRLLIKRDRAFSYSYQCPLGLPTSKEYVKKIYQYRRSMLRRGFCVRCGFKFTPTIFSCPYFPERKGELLAKNGINIDKSCPNCNTNMIEFCFQDIFDEILLESKNTTPARSTPRKKKGANKNSTDVQLSIF